MYLDKNYDRSQKDGGNIGDIKYKDHYEAYPNAHTGEVLDAEILLAQMSVVTRQNKKGGEYSREMLSVVFKVKEKYWIRLNIKGAYLKDGKPERNPVLLHDFLCLAERQHANCLGDAFTHTFDDGHEVTAYPTLVGMRFKIVIATVGTFQGYDVNEFRFFDTAGNSAVELELGQQGTFIEIKQAIEDLKKAYQEYRDTTAITENPYGTQEQKEEQAQQEATEPKEPSNKLENDDIPF